MPVGIIRPSNNIKFTNVSLVRLKKGSKRFELACYKNKVLEWRSGNEKDLDEVVQIRTVYLNVSKALTAPTADLEKAFGTKSIDDIILEILNKGELQVGDKERHAALDRVHHEVIDIVAGKLVDPRSKRVYTPGMIEKALDQLSGQSAQARQQQDEEAERAEQNGEDGSATRKPIWTGVSTSKNAKSQALDAMKALIAWQPIPLARARMRLRVTCPMAILKQSVKSAGAGKKDENGEEEKVKGTVKDRILSYIEEVESQDDVAGDWEVTGFVEPGAFKPLGEFIGGETKGKGRLEVLDMAVMHNE